MRAGSRLARCFAGINRKNQAILLDVGKDRQERLGEKMNQKMKYAWLAIGIIVVIVLGDYICYRVVITQMEQMQSDYEKRVSELVEVDVTTQLENKAEKVVKRIVRNQTESVSANVSKEKLGVNTVFQVQKYNATKDTTVSEYETLPQDLVGKTRSQVDEYCKNYMNRLTAEEYLDGLQSIGVVTFSSEHLVIRKIYDSSKVKFRYYMIAVDGEVVVYYGDKKTVYEYTGIETDGLSKEEKTMLKKGVEVKDEEELYSILENYSS